MHAGAVQGVREEEVVVARGAARRPPRVVQRHRHRQDKGSPLAFYIRDYTQYGSHETYFRSYCVLSVGKGKIRENSCVSLPEHEVFSSWWCICSQAVQDYLADLLESQRKFICFAHHQVSWQISKDGLYLLQGDNTDNPS